MNGATDARHLKSLNIPIAIMGIVGGGAHSANEFANLDTIDSLAEIFERFVMEE